jgi:hypothetical protein
MSETTNGVRHGMTQGPEWELMSPADHLGAIADAVETGLTQNKALFDKLEGVEMACARLEDAVGRLQRLCEVIGDRLLSASLRDRESARRAALAPAAVPAAPVHDAAPELRALLASEALGALLRVRPEGQYPALAGEAVDCADYLLAALSRPPRGEGQGEKPPF